MEFVTSNLRLIEFGITPAGVCAEVATQLVDFIHEYDGIRDLPWNVDQHWSHTRACLISPLAKGVNVTCHRIIDAVIEWLDFQSLNDFARHSTNICSPMPANLGHIVQPANGEAEKLPHRVAGEIRWNAHDIHPDSVLQRKIG